jgi:hypothetical protein
MKSEMLKEISKTHETSLQSRSIMEENQIKNNDSFERLEANIIMTREMFKEGIQIIHQQMMNEESLREPTSRIVEVLENGQEI